MTSDSSIPAIASAVLQRVNEARAAYLVRTGSDYLWADLGRALGWSQPTTSVIRNGKRPLALEELPRIAEALGVRVEWLAFGSGPMREATGPARGRAVGQEPETVVAVRPLAPAKKRRAR